MCEELSLVQETPQFKKKKYHYDFSRSFKGETIERLDNDKIRGLTRTETRKHSEVFEDGMKFVHKVKENFKFSEDSKLKVNYCPLKLY